MTRIRLPKRDKTSRAAYLRGSCVVVLTLTVTLLGCPFVSDQRAEARRQSRTAGVESGHASWYGKTHDGLRTASGERFDMRQLTAAHRTLPLGTRVLVTNVKNGRSVEVRVNDRGPTIRGRIIDLSYAAAQRLGAVAQGTVPVRIRVLS